MNTPRGIGEVEMTYSWREAACDCIGDGRVAQLDDLLPGFREWLTNLGTMSDDDLERD